ASATDPQARCRKASLGSLGEMERGRLRRARGRRRDRAHHESHRCAGGVAVVLDARLRLPPRPQANPRLCRDTRDRYGGVREELAPRIAFVRTPKTCSTISLPTSFTDVDAKGEMRLGLHAARPRSNRA